MAVNHAYEPRSVDDRLSKIEAQNDAILKALKQKKKNIVFVSV